MTSVSISYGNENLQTYFSYANTTGKGIIDKNKLKKHNINLRETATMFDKRLKLDGSVNVMKQTVENKPVSGGFYMNPLVGPYRFLVGRICLIIKIILKPMTKNGNWVCRIGIRLPKTSNRIHTG